MPTEDSLPSFFMKLHKNDDTVEIRAFFKQMKKKTVDFVIQTTMHQKVQSLLSQLVETPDTEKLTSFPYLMWKGETQDGYFRIIFYAGVIVMVFSEREMMLDYTPGVNIACVPEFREMLNVPGTADRMTRNVQYMVDEYPKQLENIRFSDIMRVLGWRYTKKGTKVEVNWFDG